MCSTDGFVLTIFWVTQEKSEHAESKILTEASNHARSRSVANDRQSQFNSVLAEQVATSVVLPRRDSSLRALVMFLQFLRVVRCCGFLSVAMLVASSVAPAEGQVTLALKNVEGRKTTTHTNMKLKQSLTLAGMALDTESDRFIISTATTGKRDEDGKIKVSQKVDKLSLTSKLPGGISLTFDSDDPGKKAENPLLEPVLELLRASVKANITLVHDKAGKVVAVEGLDKAAEPLPAELKDEFSEERTKKNANQELDRLPTEPVKAGHKWTKNSDLDLGSGQVMSFTTEYTYVGETKEGTKTLDKISAKATAVTFSLDANSKLPLKVNKSDLKIGESAETMLFDREAGLWHSVKSKVQIQGEIEFSINGQSLPGKLDLTIETDTARQP